MRHDDEEEGSEEAVKAGRGNSSKKKIAGRRSCIEVQDQSLSAIYRFVDSMKRRGSEGKAILLLAIAQKRVASHPFLHCSSSNCRHINVGGW
jgi:hypothetical protein